MALPSVSQLTQLGTNHNGAVLLAGEALVILDSACHQAANASSKPTATRYIKQRITPLDISSRLWYTGECKHLKYDVQRFSTP